MSKIFITGGAGFIGYFIARELLSIGDKVVIYDAFLNYANPFASHYNEYLKFRLDNLKGRAVIIRGDVRNKNELFRAIVEHKPDIIVHLAALPIATASNRFSEDAMSINLNGTVNVLESIRLVPSVKRFVYASSSMVYGNFEYIPADEEHPKKPLDVYGATKKAGELLTRAYTRQYGIQHTIIRPSAVYGPTDANLRVSQIFVDNALQGKALILHNGGSSKLDFSFVEDVAHGFVLAMKSKKAVNQTFNITRGEGRSLREFVDILKQHIPNIKVKYKERPKSEKRPERGALDISKARKLLGYNPQFSLEKGIEKYIDFVRRIGVVK